MAYISQLLDTFELSLNNRAGTWLGTSRLSRLGLLWLQSVDWRLYLRLPVVIYVQHCVETTSRHAKEIAVLFTLTTAHCLSGCNYIFIPAPDCYLWVSSKWNSSIDVCSLTSGRVVSDDNIYLIPLYVWQMVTIQWACIHTLLDKHNTGHTGALH
jgi:hypothetical protein